MTSADFPEARSERTGARELVDELADAVLTVPGVTGLHSGLFGEVATYLPGRRISGITLDDDTCEIHIVASLTGDLQAVAATVRDTAERIAGRPVEVVVEDITIDPTPTPKEGDAQ